MPARFRATLPLETWPGQWLQQRDSARSFPDGSLSKCGITACRETMPATPCSPRWRHDLPMVATNNVHYHDRSEADIAEVLAAIGAGSERGVRALARHRRAASEVSGGDGRPHVPIPRCGGPPTSADHWLSISNSWHRGFPTSRFPERFRTGWSTCDTWSTRGAAHLSR